MLPRGARQTLLPCLLAIGLLSVDLSVTGQALPRAAAAAADGSADIPGVPLPGPIAAGRLGGAVYDVVYRLAVEPGYVIVASLTGADGTDFDLYLFDETATTVLSTTGLLTRSAGPTSTESVSWPSRLGGVYYIDLNGATDVEGDFRLTVQTIPDPTPPVVAVTLGGGRASTNDLTVPVTVSGTEDLSGIAEMAFSLDGIAFGNWEPFQAASTYTLPAGDGVRNLWVKVRNGVGLESTPAVDSIVVDTVAPTVTAVYPLPGMTVAGLRPALTVTFNEPIDPSSWADLGLIVQSASGSLMAGAYSYDAVKRQGTFVPSASLQPGASHAVNVGKIRDIAGNEINPLPSWSITPLQPTQLDVEAAPHVLGQGVSSRISVTFSGASPPVAVDMLSSNPAGGFDAVSAFDLADGQISLLVAPVRNTTYRFQYAGAFGIAPSQADARILVRRSIVLAGRNSAAVARGRVGTTVRLTAAVAPAASGVSISFRMYRFDPARRTWIYAGSFGRKSSAAGRAFLDWAPATTGTFYWRATVGSTPEFANNTTPVYRWSIRR